MSVEKISFQDIQNVKSEIDNEKQVKNAMKFFQTDEILFPETSDSKFVGGAVELSDEKLKKLKKAGII